MARVFFRAEGCLDPGLHRDNVFERVRRMRAWLDNEYQPSSRLTSVMTPTLGSHFPSWPRHSAAVLRTDTAQRCCAPTQRSGAAHRRRPSSQPSDFSQPSSCLGARLRGHDVVEVGINRQLRNTSIGGHPLLSRERKKRAISIYNLRNSSSIWPIHFNRFASN